MKEEQGGGDFLPASGCKRDNSHVCHLCWMLAASSTLMEGIPTAVGVMEFGSLLN